MVNKCYPGHSPFDDQQKRIAPLMEAIKAHYIDDKTTKELFTEYVDFP